VSVSRFRVALLTAEAVPFAKVGGLADVAGALSRTSAALGCSVAVFLPRYGDLSLPPGSDLELVARIDVPVSGADRPGLVYRLRNAGHPTHLHHFFLSNEELFGRPGVYGDPETHEPFADAAERSVFFSRGCLEAMRAVAYVPDVIHANDHPTALVPAYLKTLHAEDAFFQMTATLLTVHNLGYQGAYPPEAMRVAGFPDNFFYPLSPFEFWGKMNCLKAGIQFADRINTVSERHAEEIQSGDEYGFGLQGVLNARRENLTGILNGIDVKTWNPRTDRALPARYDAEALEGKSICKAALVEELGLAASPDRPLFGIVSRLVEQKGFELFERAAERLMALPARWAVLGRGESRFEDLFRSLAARHPDRIAYRGEFLDPLAHRIEGGADFFLMPSRYEPCGLNQMMSMRYGTVPVVRETGGLADTVTPFVAEDPSRGTGILFRPYTPEALVGAVEEAIRLYAHPSALQRCRRNGMACDFSWEGAARKYVQLYREANASRRIGTGFGRWLETIRRGESEAGPSAPARGWEPPSVA
jgi:starch synthase